MSLASATFGLGSASSSIFELNAQQSGSFRPSDRSLFQAANWAGTINGRYWVKTAHVEPRSELNVSLAATFAASVVIEEVYESIKDDYGKLNKDLGRTSLENGTKALEKLGDIDIISTVAFSGAEDVTLIESWLTVCFLLAFSVDTGKLNSNTSCQFFDAWKKLYGIHIDLMFLDAVEVLALVGNINGLLLSHKYGYQECCQVSKVTPLWRALKSLLAWIRGVKDPSPGSTVGLPVVRVIDPSFEGREYGGIGSLLKWDAMSNADNQECWRFLQATNVLLNSISFQRYVSDSHMAGYELCPRSVLPWQGGKEGRWWWEETEAEHFTRLWKDHSMEGAFYKPSIDNDHMNKAILYVSSCT